MIIIVSAKQKSESEETLENSSKEPQLSVSHNVGLRIETRFYFHLFLCL